MSAHLLSDRVLDPHRNLNHGLYAKLHLGGSMSGLRVPETALFRRNKVTLLAQLVARGVALLVQLVVGSDVPRGINRNDFFRLWFIFVPANPRACPRPTGWFVFSPSPQLELQSMSLQVRQICKCECTLIDATQSPPSPLPSAFLRTRFVGILIFCAPKNSQLQSPHT